MIASREQQVLTWSAAPIHVCIHSFEPNCEEKWRLWLAFQGVPLKKEDAKGIEDGYHPSHQLRQNHSLPLFDTAMVCHDIIEHLLLGLVV